MSRKIKYLILALCFATAVPLYAQSGRDAVPTTPEMEALRKQIKQYEEEIRISTELLNKTQKDRTASESQLKIIRERLSNRRKIVASLEKQLGLTESEIKSKNKDIAQLNAKIQKLRKDYADMVYTAYKNYKLNNFLLFLFSSDDFNMASRRADFMRRYNHARQDKAGQIASLSDSIRREVAKLDAAREEMAHTRQTHSEEVVSLGKDETQYKNTVTKLTSEQRKLQQQVKEKEKLKEQVQRQIQELVAAEVRRAQGQAASDADLRAIAELSGRFDQNKGKLPYPITGGVIIDRFGEHNHQLVSSIKATNDGINIAGPGGALVNCVFEGNVVGIFSMRWTNNICVLVRHGNYITVYANIVSTLVKNGAEVRAGQPIGRIANSQNDDENFLHFEIHREKETLNPEQWLRR